jgi:formylglycine-generating enzyme required for sulfatase activity
VSGARAFGCAILLGAALAASPSPAAQEVPEVIEIPAGRYIAGSSPAEREYAYRIDERAYGHDATRRQRWYESEPPRASRRSARYAITRTPITNRQYAAFVAATGHRAPEVDAATWRGYGFIHEFAATRRFAWSAGRPPSGREEHPVVLVSHADASAYAAWLSRETGRTWRLPTQAEWEKAARGSDGRIFPWGDEFDPKKLNSHDAGPFDTTPVGSYPLGASPFGMLDAAGQVFEWTSSAAGSGRFVVKGGSWDDKGCGVCRPAAGHARPAAVKHVLIGFRLVREAYGRR